MQCQSGYQNNSVLKSPFSFRSPAANNTKAPYQLHPHSLQVNPMQNLTNPALKINNNKSPYNKDTSNYLKKNSRIPIESNDKPLKSDNEVGNVEDNVAIKEKVRVSPIVRVFTGNVDKLIKWHKLLNSTHIIYEVIGCVIQISAGAIAQQRIMLLRSCQETGPVLQIIYYHMNVRINISDFYIGQKLRIVGQMIGTNMLRAHSIRDSTPEEVRRLSRLQAISDRTISKLVV